ncbi:MAG: hypothetical protein M3246_08075 [Actinomycetota bacterium]|nr:hypothetical protein [Actinomycetota bacterium]
MESWRRAWKGNAPVEPFEDTEWLERRKEALTEWLSDLTTASDEVAAEEYRHIQALWLFDHVDVLEEAGEISAEDAAELRKIMRGQ